MDDSIAERIRQMMPSLQRLQALQSEIAAAAHAVQDVLAFDAHPDLVSLDGELDNLYRGEL